MSYAYTWPGTLPQRVEKGYTESRGVLIIKTSMDAGPAKMRRRGQKPDMLNVSFLMTTTQITDLETFVNDVLKGVARFGFPHPRLTPTTYVETRLVPQDSGTLYSVDYVAPGYYKVAMQLEILP